MDKRIIALRFGFWTFRKTNSIVRPVPNRSTAATKKSNTSQRTSSVKAIEIKGIKRIDVAIDNIARSLLFLEIVMR